MRLLTLLLLGGVFLLASPNASATEPIKKDTKASAEESVAVTLRYYNKDSKTHKFKVKISGSTREVEFGSSRTASVTIQGGATECVISCSCGDVKVKGGDHITIKDGCIKVD